MALQFAPMILLLPVSGLAADHFDRRRLLLWAAIASGVLTLGLGVLTASGLIALWQVYLFGFLLGCVTAFEAPTRHTFVAELVGERDLANAVALNSLSFSAARLLGPAIAGLLIEAVGSGGAFLLNSASYGAAIASLCLLSVSELRRERVAVAVRGNLAEGLRYVRSRNDLRAVLVMLFLIGTFGLNFPVFISAMAVEVFNLGAAQYGLLMSVMAVGSIVGAVLVARDSSPGMPLLLLTVVVFGFGLALAALAPEQWSFAATLVFVGGSSVAFTTATSSFMQLASHANMRGRVIALRIGVAMGGTPVGAPAVGWVADTFGPRWAVGVGALSGFLSALVALRYLVRHRNLRVRFDGHGIRLQMRDELPRKDEAGEPR